MRDRGAEAAYPRVFSRRPVARPQYTNPLLSVSADCLRGLGLLPDPVGPPALIDPASTWVGGLRHARLVVPLRFSAKFICMQKSSNRLTSKARTHAQRCTQPDFGMARHALQTGRHTHMCFFLPYGHAVQWERALPGRRCRVSRTAGKV